MSVRYRVIVTVQGGDALDAVLRVVMDVLTEIGALAMLRVERVDPRRNGHQ